MNSSFGTFRVDRSSRGGLQVPRIGLAAAVVLVAACLATGPLHADPVTIDWVTVGNPGNAADGNGRGRVNDAYRIGKYEVTIGQYTEFLNAVAATDTYSLYNMGLILNASVRGIQRDGVDGSYQYVSLGSANKPVAFVTWWDAARFANWMHNGQPTGPQGIGTTETGAYTLNGATSGAAPARNPGATVFLPTSDEWYKAAYYSPTKDGTGGYYTYAMQSDTAPGNVVGSNANQANYRTGGGTIYSVTQSSSFNSNQNYLTDAGAFTNSASYYGTFDQNGNVSEWSSPTAPASNVSNWGGSWRWGIVDLMKGSPASASTDYSDAGYGFRLAAVPEPSTYAMALAGIACSGYSMWRRTRRETR